MRNYNPSVTFGDSSHRRREGDYPSACYAGTSPDKGRL